MSNKDILKDIDSGKYASRGDRYVKDRARELTVRFIKIIKGGGSVKDLLKFVGGVCFDGAVAQSVILNDYDILRVHDKRDSCDDFKAKVAMLNIETMVYLETINKNKDNQSLAKFYARGDK